MNEKKGNHEWTHTVFGFIFHHNMLARASGLLQPLNRPPLPPLLARVTLLPLTSRTFVTFRDFSWMDLPLCSNLLCFGVFEMLQSQVGFKMWSSFVADARSVSSFFNF